MRLRLYGLLYLLDLGHRLQELVLNQFPFILQLRVLCFETAVLLRCSFVHNLELVLRLLLVKLQTLNFLPLLLVFLFLRGFLQENTF